MHHYEIMLMFHPDQSDQMPATIQRYIELINKNKGRVHRYEDCGRRQLAYTIQKVNKAHYVLLNIECDAETYKELVSAFRFNDAILRELILRLDEAVTTPSPFSLEKTAKTKTEIDGTSENTEEE